MTNDCRNLFFERGSSGQLEIFASAASSAPASSLDMVVMVVVEVRACLLASFYKLRLG